MIGIVRIGMLRSINKSYLSRVQGERWPRGADQGWLSIPFPAEPSPPSPASSSSRSVASSLLIGQNRPFYSATEDRAFTMRSSM